MGRGYNNGNSLEGCGYDKERFRIMIRGYNNGKSLELWDVVMISRIIGRGYYNGKS